MTPAIMSITQSTEAATKGILFLNSEAKTTFHSCLRMVTIFSFVVDRVTYLILAGENNHYGRISLDEKKISRVVTQPRTPLERITDLT